MTTHSHKRLNENRTASISFTYFQSSQICYSPYHPYKGFERTNVKVQSLNDQDLVDSNGLKTFNCYEFNKQKPFMR